MRAFLLLILRASVKHFGQPSGCCKCAI